MTKVPRIAIASDVLGTLFSMDKCALALSREQLFVSSLRGNADEQAALDRADCVVREWYHACQRDFTYLSINGKYTPIPQVFRANLPRSLSQAGVSMSDKAASESLVSNVCAQLKSLDARPSLLTALSVLRAAHESGQASIRFLAATNGTAEVTKGLFKLAGGPPPAFASASGEDAGSEEDEWHVLSCDEVRKAKPEPALYEACWQRLGFGDGGERHGWFVASHMWDLYAAKLAGFKTAWVSYEEFVLTPGSFGEPDVVATDLVDAMNQIIARETDTQT